MPETQHNYSLSWNHQSALISFSLNIADSKEAHVPVSFPPKALVCMYLFTNIVIVTLYWHIRQEALQKELDGMPWYKTRFYRWGRTRFRAILNGDDRTLSNWFQLSLHRLDIFCQFFFFCQFLSTVVSDGLFQPVKKKQFLPSPIRSSNDWSACWKLSGKYFEDT